MRELPTNSVFQRSWWLDAVAPGAWDIVEVSSEKHGLDAWLPYVVRFNSRGLTIIDMPPLTTSLGPWVREPKSQSPRKQLSHYMSILGELADALPEAQLFRQSFHHSIPTALPFSHRGFDLRLGYTYFIPELGSEDEIWQTISTSRRQDIQKARPQLEVHPSEDLELFLRLSHLTFERQGVPNPYPDDYVSRIYHAAVANDAGSLLIAFDRAGNAHGGHFLVYDDATTNGLMSGLDPAYRDSNAGSLLMWEALRFAAKQSRSFNFSGGTIPGVEPFISSFGGQQVPYVKVTRGSLRWRSLSLAKDSAKRLTSLPAKLKARGSGRS